MNIAKISRRLRYHLKSLVDHRVVSPMADALVDVVMPVTRKDLSTLPLAIEGVRRCVSHRIGAIYIVAAPDKEIMELCGAEGLEFVDERSVLGYGPADMKFMAGNPPRDRSGWVFQQLLKLSGKIGTSPWFITIDADHVLLRPHTFIGADGRLCFYQSKEYHPPYYANMNRLIGLKPDSGLSYVAHKMVFDREILSRLRGEIERMNPGLRWDEAVIASIDRHEMSGFSEFELYGNYVARSRKHLLPFVNHHLPQSSAAGYDELLKRYGRLRAVTFPDYLS